MIPTKPSLLGKQVPKEVQKEPQAAILEEPHRWANDFSGKAFGSTDSQARGAQRPASEEVAPGVGV